MSAGSCWRYSSTPRSRLPWAARGSCRLVLEYDAYRWISGGVQVNHHSLSDFPVAHGAALDELSTSVAGRIRARAVKLERVAQDGVHVRAAAGAASFRRKASPRRTAAGARPQQRARREMAQRVQQALDRLPELQTIKRRNSGNCQARASTADAQAGVMKMAEDGFRTAYNTRFASAFDAQVIVGVGLSTSGSDMAQLASMVDQVEQRLREVPVQGPRRERSALFVGRSADLAPSTCCPT